MPDLTPSSANHNTAKSITLLPSSPPAQQNVPSSVPHLPICLNRTPLYLPLSLCPLCPCPLSSVLCPLSSVSLCVPLCPSVPCPLCPCPLSSVSLCVPLSSVLYAPLICAISPPPLQSPQPTNPPVCNSFLIPPFLLDTSWP